MLYKYNGIVMQMTKTNNIQFDAVFTDDRTTYLYTHYLIDIQAVVNPQTMAYVGGPGIGSPVELPGTFPAQTIKAIRHELLQPRNPLLIIDELGNELLSTPAVGSMSDAKSGPLPISCTITNVAGARTLMIQWKCEGWIYECPSIDDTPIIISNRWSDQMSINEYQLTNRVFIGHTIFNKGLLDNTGVSADRFRNMIFPGITPGFQRKNVEIVQTPDGAELMWRVTDMEGMYVIGDTDPGFLPAGGDATMKGSGILELEGVQSLIGFKPDGSKAALMGNALNQIKMRAKGSRNANQWTMIQRLIEVIATLTPTLIAGGPPGSEKTYWIMDASLTRSLGQREKWVEISVSILCPPPADLKNGMANLNTEPLELYTDIYYAIGSIVDQKTGISPALLEDDFGDGRGGSRGSNIAELMTQILTNTCRDQTDLPDVSFGYTAGPGLPGKPVDPGSPAYSRPIIPESPSKYKDNKYPYTSGSITYGARCITGTKAIPMTGPSPGLFYQQGGTTTRGPTCAIVRTHLDYTIITYEGMFERIGKFPLMPNPVPKNPNQFVLIDWYLSPFFPAPSYDGINPVYRCDFRYVYIMQSAPDPSQFGLILGQLPWSLIPPENVASTDTEAFSQDILGI